MADSLFDNRYRYDYIYPRGRSGETLRAEDTEQNDRPVVIKRPAFNDAPPIRAGQEVSIMTERKALMRLEDNSVATEYLGSGQFLVGGANHQYIVMERAEGVIVEDEVLELARQGERLPELEMLVILDNLLGLLKDAHSKEIVYNDVDAKHLFWDRERYRLKVIDWGNAVFLEGDEVTPQGVSRQSDIFQVGELMFFILSGGRRADIPRDAGAEFRLDFGEDAEHVSLAMQNMVSKAAHPNPRLRYRSIEELRRALSRYAQPIKRERDAVVNRVIERLRHDLSKTELRSLIDTLEPALETDFGFPPARRAYDEINDRLRDLDVSADLDAVMIYMRNENWSRAADLLKELHDGAGPKTSSLVELLLDSTLLILDSELEDVPPAVLDALERMYEGQINNAAHTLMTTDHPDGAARRLQWLMAERISSRIPDVLLLRPNLYRLELALSAVGGDGVNLNDARALLGEINTLLDDINGQSRDASMVSLRDAYRMVVDHLQTLNKLLSTVAAQQRLSNRHLPLSSLDRALNAAMALADNMHVIGKQATGSPREARLALENSRAIDPVNPVWHAIGRMLDSLYELLQSYQTYVPSADGSDLESWLKTAHDALDPFVERLFDELLLRMTRGLETALEAWHDYNRATISGNRAGAIDALTQATSSVSTISPTLANWLNQLRSVVEGANYVERHAVFGGLGRALADGWEAFDRGRLADAERLAQQAQNIARGEAENAAAERLAVLAGTVREWVERNGIVDRKRTHTALDKIEGLFTEEERKQREDFASQMPSSETYLRAMNKGLIQVYLRQSTSALRLYFIHCILSGALEAHDSSMTDAEFWRDVGVKAVGSFGTSHPATGTLEDFIGRRRNIDIAEQLLNTLDGKHALESLEKVRREIEDNPENRTLAAAIHGIRELEGALREWTDGEFRPAGLKLENVLKSIDEVQKTAQIQVPAWQAWIESLNAQAAELYNIARQMRQTIERRPADPDPQVREAHRVLAQRTTELLGTDYSAQMRLWYDTYEDFLAAYTDLSVRRSARLERMNELFKAMFIDRHPAYPLYRFWYDVTEDSPEFPAPPTSDPTPRLDDAEDNTVEDSEILGDADSDTIEPFTRSRYTADDDARPSRRRRPPLWLILIGLLALIAVAGAGVLLLGGSDDGGDDNPLAMLVTAEATQTVEAAGAVAGTVAAESTEETTETAPPTLDPDELITPTLITRTAIFRPSSTPMPTAEITTPAPPTETDIPTETPVPTETPIPTETPTPTLTLTPTLPPDGLTGTQSLLQVFARIPEAERTWSQDVFSPGTDASTWRLETGPATVDDGTEVVVAMPAETLDLYFGADAPRRIRRTQVVFDLLTYNASTLEADDVAFGLMLQDAADPAEQVGVYIQLANLQALNLYVREGDAVTFVRQISVGAPNPRVRIDRDAINGDVRLFVDDLQVGETLSFLSPDAPVRPAIFVSNGGVTLNVRDWRVFLQ